MCRCSNVNCFSGSMQYKSVSDQCACTHSFHTSAIVVSDETYLYSLTECPHPAPAMSTRMSERFSKTKCSGKKSKQSVAGAMPDCLGHILHAQSHELLLELIAQSLQDICAAFGPGPSSPDTCDLTIHTQTLRALAPQLTHTDRLVLFLLLLNVDLELKTKIYELDTENNYFKITRFLRDLQSAVVDFYTDMRISKSAFLETCERLYILA